MKRTSQLLLATSLFTLSACAIAPEDAASGTTASAIVGTNITPVDDTPCAGEAPDATAARLAIANIRALAGLPAAKCDVAASRATAGHCNYLQVNDAFSHIQDPSRPAFTGVTPAARLAASHYAMQPAIEVLASLTGADAITAPRGLLNSVYHRVAFLREEDVSFGYGSATACATIDFGRAAGPTLPTTTVVWPPDASTNAPTSFYAEDESPNPVPGATIVGAPVTLIAKAPLTGLKATLTGPQGIVEATLITADTDATGFVLANEAHLVPRQPLEANTTYTATFTAAAGTIDAKSTFVTGPTDE